MKALVTGSEGFVGPYLVSFLQEQQIEVIRTDLLEKKGDPHYEIMDVTIPDHVNQVMERVKPDLVFHLAGFSSVATSFKNPDLCKRINVDGTINIFNAIINAKIGPRVLVVSSAEVYGKPQFLPISEKHPLAPLSPYAESRVQQEKLSLEYAKKNGITVIISRSFNHSGPGQADTFVLSSFAKQVVAIEKKKQDHVMVGNLDAIRDFSDVRDVVRGYYLLIKKGKKGCIYNICSGKGYSIKGLLDLIIKQSTAQIKIMADPQRLRPSDIPVLVGDHRNCTSRTGWYSVIPIEKTLGDLLEYWRNRL